MAYFESSHPTMAKKSSLQCLVFRAFKRKKEGMGVDLYHKSKKGGINCKVLQRGP